MTINSFGDVVEAPQSAPQAMQVIHRAAPADLQDGQVHAAIESVALTANNVTYALFGAVMGYWGFFPASSDQNGVVPVWGFARVTASKHPDVKEGARLYGFWPFAQSVVLEPKNVSARGFSDGAAHRQALHGFYNMVSFAQADPFCQGETQLVPALKPLFATAWLLADMFAANSFYGAQDMVLTSASSKTGLGTAYCLKEARKIPGQLIGLTGKGNKAFVEGTGLYDKVLTYDEIGDLPTTKACVIDFAGNAKTIAAVHAHYGDRLGYSAMVGKTHANGGAVTSPLAGPQPVLFFAPDHARDAMKRLGQDGFQTAQHERWLGYHERAQSWFDVEHVDGLTDAVKVFQALINGTADGSKAYLVAP